MTKPKKRKEELVGGALITKEDYIAVIRALKKHMPTEAQQFHGLLIPKKLWRKMKKHLPSLLATYN
jgi:hypothetical protein